MSTILKNTKTYLFTAAAVAQGRVATRTAAAATAEVAIAGTVLSGQVLLGIAEGGAVASERAEVTDFGNAKGQAGGAITVGTHYFLTSDANGDLVPAVTADLIIGRFTGETDAVAGDEIDVFVTLGVHA